MEINKSSEHNLDMAQVSITQLPQAQPLTGSESVPIVQNGVTVQTTTGQIAGAGALNYPFLTVGSTAGLTEARQLSATSGLSLTDNGPDSTLEINLTGAALSLDSSGTGIQVKTGPNTLTGRSLTVGAGLDIANADGVSGDPLISLGAALAQLVSLTGTGMLAIQSGLINKVEVLGVTNQISITNGNGAGNVTVGLATNPVIPGQGGLYIPAGTTGQRASNADGLIRYNTTLAVYEGFSNGSWREFSTGGVTLINTGSGLTGGPITSTGTIGIDDTVVAITNNVLTLTNKTISGLSNTLSDIANSSLVNDSITINGTNVALGGSVTISAVISNGLTFDNSGTGAPSGTLFDGSTAYTISYNTIGAAPTIGSTSITTLGTITTGVWHGSAIDNSYLANSSLTIGTTNVALGATTTTLAGLTSVTVTQDPVSNFQLATKQYVDTLYTTGVHYHEAVKYEVPDTTGNLNAIYNQPGGPGVGVGATLTNNGTLGAFTPDGVIASIGDRILIYNQTNQYENGVYVVTVVGNGSTAWVLTRSSDTDTYNPTSPTALGQGDAFFITSGNTGAGETYVCDTVGTIVFGTTAITFAQISSTQVYSAGTGLTLTGTQFSITNTGVTAATYGSASSVPVLAVNAQGQITSASSTSIAIDASQITSGTIDAARISGSYTGISGVGTLTVGTWNATTIGVAYGGTGQTSYTDGELLIGNSSGNTLTKATLTAGSGINITNGGGSITIAATGGGGTVTSVAQSFTGGLISVSGSPITTSGTLALTVAGTSGGIPYFSSGSTWASSAALAANALMIGGGAGFAPSTTTTGTGVLTALSNNTNTANGMAVLNSSGYLNVAQGGTGIGSGTSGGILYFSASGTIASSAALAASSIVLGGGAGAAPVTTTTGSGVVTALGNAANATGGFTTINGTATLTNKRIDPRVSSTTSTASVTPDVSAYDIYAFTAQAATLTINAPIGTPVNGDKLIFRILDNGVSQTLSWNGTYTAIGVTIPTATTAGKMTYVGCIYNEANTRWDVIAVTTQA